MNKRRAVNGADNVDVLSARASLALIICDVNDNDHSFSELPVDKALTFPEGRELGLWRLLRSTQKQLNKVFRSDLLPLEIVVLHKCWEGNCVSLRTSVP